MKKIYVIAAHSPYSPGGMCQGRTEHEDSLKFARMLHMNLERDKGLEVKLLKGDTRRLSFSEEDTVIVFHRASNMKNCASYGARAFVTPSADAEIQYDAFRLLESICGDHFFRMKGVHTETKSDFRNSINSLGTDRVFLFDLGYIDSYKDNRVLDRYYELLADRMGKKLREILKERENEDNTAV